MAHFEISNFPLFNDVSTDFINDFLERYNSNIISFQRGEYIVRQGDRIDFFYLILKGEARSEMITREGNVLEIEPLFAGYPLAPAFIFADENRFPVDVTALEDCTLMKIPKNFWLSELMNNETLLLNFFKINSNMSVFLSRKLQMISLKSLKTKLANYILENTNLQNSSFELQRTQAQLAEYFGVQRPSLARTLAEMVEKGAINIEKRVIMVKNRAMLESW